MRSLIITLSIILATVAANAQTAPSTTAPAQSADNKGGIVYINSDTLLSKYAYYAAIKVKLQALSQGAQTELADSGGVGFGTVSCRGGAIDLDCWPL